MADPRGALLTFPSGSTTSSRAAELPTDDVGVKAFTDDEGPELDPDAELPTTRRTEADVRAYLHRRFPALAEAPLLRTRSCTRSQPILG